MTALNNPKNWFIIVLLACLLMAMVLVIKHHNAMVLETDVTLILNPVHFLNKLFNLV